jgi:hypothetical protein
MPVESRLCQRAFFIFVRSAAHKNKKNGGSPGGLPPLTQTRLENEVVI